jgi:hypothetical protein
MVENLDQEAVGIAEIEGSGAVAMGFEGIDQLDAAAFNPSGYDINIVDFSNDKAYVMNALNGTRLSAIGQFMDCQIIRTRGEVNVVGIGFPFHLHTENVAVKLHGAPDVSNVQSYVAKA